jgi:alpha-ketoglutarate-dependent taurine dioxygenase
MIRKYKINKRNHKKIYQEFISDWADTNLKVFTFKSNIPAGDVRDFYDLFFSEIGKFLPYAEDGTIKDRSKGRTGEVWMEIRNVSSIKNAYRHSTNAQPLHTDGSYIPKFPVSILACVRNVYKGGETFFVDIESLLEDLKSFNNNLYDFAISEKVLHERSGENRTNKIFYVKNDILKVNFNYYCISDKNSNHISKFAKQLLDYFVLIEQNQRKGVKSISVKLETGEAVIWKDDEILHGRHDFIAHKDSERFIWKAVYQPNF